MNSSKAPELEALWYISFLKINNTLSESAGEVFGDNVFGFLK